MCSTCGCGDDTHGHHDSQPYRPRSDQPTADKMRRLRLAEWLAWTGKGVAER